MPEMFVNPLPGLRADRIIQFDFPSNDQRYRAPGTLMNYHTDHPAIEHVYGFLGTPPKHQGHPVVKEATPGAEDPTILAQQDQIVHLEQEMVIYHTGRLSGSFVNLLADDRFKSVVKLIAVPETNEPSQILYEEEVDLAPQPPDVNVWFYGGETMKELLYTAQAQFKPEDKNLKAETVYRLLAKWEFWDYTDPNNRQRMLISGFDDAVAFEVISAGAAMP